MRARHVLDRLAALADEELDVVERERVTAHLAECTACHQAWDRYRFAAHALRRLALVEAPPQILTSLERALDAPRPAAGWVSASPIRPAYAIAAALLLVALAVVGLPWRAAPPDPWDVVRLDAPVWRTARVTIGDWIETGAASTARMRIGEIGTVDVAPGSRVRLLEARPGEHRLQLAHGLISAEIVAPPRVFFVDTPASTVVDLGCAYTMEVDEDGTGELRVTEGWAALEWNDRESLVPAGASAATRPGVGPGTPSFDDASARLREALLEIDFGPPAATAGALAVVLAEARDRDTLTLWHLLSRVEPEHRTLVFERMAELTPLPAGVDRESVLALDPATLTFWREELAWTW